MANFLLNSVFQDVILPFILVFSLVFAILQKSKLLGEGKQQIDAIIAFVIAGILVSFSTQVSWIRQFIWFLVIALIILFIFMLLYGFAYGDTKGDPLGGVAWLKPTIGIMLFVAVIVASIVITGYWDKTLNFFSTGDWGPSIIFIIVAIIAISIVLKTGKKGENKS